MLHCTMLPDYPKKFPRKFLQNPSLCATLHLYPKETEMNAKLCKRIRQFLRLCETPTAEEAVRKSNGASEYPAGCFQHENTRMKRAAAAMNSTERAKAFPDFRSPVK